MNDWTAGYVADIGYTYGYYAELNPLRIRLAFLNNRLDFPDVGAACELGFGQGISVNLHAAASVTQWFGTDFNPSQASFARQVADVAGSNARLFDEAFAEFCQRKDLPDFDYIGLHGIWSWISNENRAVIVDFLRRKLKVGGVLYISYNTQPGWAAMIPMRDLLTEHSEIMGTPGQGIVSRVEGALAFAGKLLATNPVFAQANPSVVPRLEALKVQDRHYLAHEYFNRDWLPMPFSRMGEWLAPTKLSYVCSAHYFDHVEVLNLMPEQQALLRDIPHALFRETVRDFCVNQQFRRDYWVKGGRTLSVAEQLEKLRAERVILTQPRSEVTLKANGVLGEATMQATIYDPILDVLADYQPKSLGQIEQAVRGQGVDWARMMQAMIILCGKDALSIVQEEDRIAQARPATERLNAYLCNKARGSEDIHYLASPVTGGGVALSRFVQLMLLARKQGKQQPEEWAQFTWDILASQGQRILKEGKALVGDAENLAELREHAHMLADKLLPVLHALGIAG